MVLNAPTAWKVPKYQVYFGPYFSVVFSPNSEKYGPEKTLCSAKREKINQQKLSKA